MFQRRTSGYIIVDVAASIMFSGYFWLAFFEAKNFSWRAVQGGLPLLQVTRLVSSGAEYTPLITACQYVVVIFFFNAL